MKQHFFACIVFTITLAMIACGINRSNPAPQPNRTGVFIPYGGWVTAFDLSFAAQPTLSIPTIGAYTVAGNTNWRKIVSNDQTTMAITNDAGLVVIPVASTDINGAAFNAPLFGVQLASVIPGFYPAMPIRVWGYISARNITTQYDNAIIGISAWTAAALTGNVQVMKYGFGPVAGKAGASLEFESAGIAQHFNDYGNSTTAPQDNVVMIEYPMGLTHFSATTYSGTWSSGWPAISAMKARAALNAANGGGSTPVFGTQAAESADAANLVDATGYYAILGAMRAGSGTALSITWSQFRIDFHP